MSNLKLLGSGAKYFDISLPCNNAQSPSYQPTLNWDSIPSKERIEHSFALINNLFIDFNIKAWPNIKSLLDEIVSNPSLHHHIAFRMPSPVFKTSYNIYPDNRLTLLHIMSRRTIPQTLDSIEAYKYTINCLIKCGLNPLEKCYEEGLTPFAIMLGSQRGPTVDMLNFFASLSPGSMSDLDELAHLGSFMTILVSTMQPTYVFDWAVQNLPADKLEENIAALDRRRVLPAKYAPFREKLYVRLEKSRLEAAIEEISSPSLLKYKV